MNTALGRTKVCETLTDLVRLPVVGIYRSDEATEHQIVIRLWQQVHQRMARQSINEGINQRAR